MTENATQPATTYTIDIEQIKMNTQPLIEYFNKFIPLTKEELAFVENVFIERRIKRRQFILQEGDICNHNTFVVEGCFRMYTVDENGKEHNLQFAIENWWIGDIGSFHSKKPSELYIEALENSVILQIKKEDRLSLLLITLNSTRFLGCLLRMQW